MDDERQDNCADLATPGRLGSPVAVAAKYDLELVAGNFFFTSYTDISDDILCYYTKCTGVPFPYPVAGINDGPECQQ
jgi:hypothetical protein